MPGRRRGESIREMIGRRHRRCGTVDSDYYGLRLRRVSRPCARAKCPPTSSLDSLCPASQQANTIHQIGPVVPSIADFGRDLPQVDLPRVAGQGLLRSLCSKLGKLHWPVSSVVYRAHSQGCHPRRSAGAPADAVRTGHQHEDREGIWPHHSIGAARPCR